MLRRFLLAGLPGMPVLLRGAQKARRLGVQRLEPHFLATLPRLMELATVPGVGIGIVQREQPLWEHYAGVTNANTKQPVTAESLFPGASLGKPLFGCLVLQLAQEKRIDLDRPLNDYLSDDRLVGKYGDRVTARHVLSHSTGLTNWQRKNGQLVPEFEPGTRFRYSGQGFYHLQRVVEKITGKGFEALIEERIFAPLGITSSTYLWRGDAEERLVAGHTPEPVYERDLAKRVFALTHARQEPPSYWTHDRILEGLSRGGGKIPDTNEMLPNSAFSLLTTVRDYARFAAALVERRPGGLGLTEETRTAMMRPASKINSALGWGLGIGTEEEEGHRWLWQWGDNGGWKNLLLADPATGSGIVVFTNGRNGMRIIERIVRAATGTEHPVFLWV